MKKQTKDMRKKIIVGMPISTVLARKIAQVCSARYMSLKITYFPDKEMLVKFPIPVKGERVIIVQSMHPEPNQRMMESIFACHTARQLGAKQIELVAPYLGYMRQDKQFHDGEGISNQIMASLLSCFDKLYTIDPHLHRIRHLKEIFKIPTVTLTANSAIAGYIHKKYPSAVIIGPDWESYQWAESIAQQIGAQATILEKTRFSSRKVEVKMIKEIPLEGKDAIIVDDIISSGHTIIEAAKKVKHLGAKRVIAIGVHGLFMEGAIEKMKREDVTEVLATNTIASAFASIDISKLIAEHL